MKHPADLHTHTTASDGQYSPAALVGLARDAGLEYMAVTDHDTLRGLPEAMAAGKKLGIQVIPGVELSASEDRHLHILGLNVQTGHTPLSALCQKMRQEREQRKHRIMDFLKQKGIHIPLEEVERQAGNAAVGRPHFAQVIVRHGYASTNREVFDHLLDTLEYHESVKEHKPSPVECIRAIHAAGGKAVLAHPYQLGYGDAQLTELVSHLRECGLDGLECYYPKHSAEQTVFYLKLAKCFSLSITGGSDFHGETVKPDVELLPVELDLEWLLGKYGLI